MNTPLYPRQPDRSSKPLFAPPPEGWEKLPIGYKWPASRLSPENMRRLTILSNQTRRPITKLLQEAVELFCEQELVPGGRSPSGPKEADQVVLAESITEPEMS